MPTCLLVRHGRTHANASGTLAGWTPGVGLDEIGRERVHDLAQRLKDVPVRAVVSSPLQRCRETAGILVGEAWPGVPVTEQDDLGECRYGAWTGRKLSELAKEDMWRVVQSQPSAARFPDGDEFSGESIAEMSARGVRAIRAADADVATRFGPDAIWVAVSHGDVIKAILADAAGAHLDAFQRFVVGPASVSAIRYTPGRPFVLRSNDTGTDLAGLLPAAPKGTGDGGGPDPDPSASAAPQSGTTDPSPPVTDTTSDAVLGGGA